METIEMNFRRPNLHVSLLNYLVYFEIFRHFPRFI